MSSEPGNSSSQTTREAGKFKYGFGLWWTLALLIVMIAVVVFLAMA